MSDDPARKAKVLHTRIPESLEHELRDKAKSLGLSVSTLVRNILGNTFGLVEDLVVDSANIARSARGEEPEAAYPPLDVQTSSAAETSKQPNRLIGWQTVVLNMNALCDRCNGLLPKGCEAAVSVYEYPAPRKFICLQTLAQLRGDAIAECPIQNYQADTAVADVEPMTDTNYPGDSHD